MKLKKVKRLLGLMLAVAMTVGTLTACGGAAEQEAESTQESTTAEVESEEAPVEEVDVTYPMEGNVTLTIAAVEEPQFAATGAKNMFETPFGKAWQERTGVTLEVIHLADADAMNLLFAGGELPDLIYYHFAGNYAGGAAKAIKDKVIEPLNDYTQYMPDMMDVLESNSEYKKATTTDEGYLIGAPMIRGDEILKTSAGMMIRKDWLDDLGLEVPKTADDLYEALKAFKEEKGADAPWSSNAYWLKDFALGHGLITSAFGLPKCNFYQKDGTVHYGYYENEYKDALAWLNKLYNDGLLDPNFQTLDGATMNSNIMNGVSGMTIGSTGGNMGNYLNTMAESDPKYDLAGIAPLVVKEGDVAMSTFYGNAVDGAMLVMTPACENKEAAAKFMNYGYTEEGSMLMNFGIEGESYEMVDGYPTYTDVIMNNPDGLTIQQAMTQYMRSWGGGPFVQRKEYLEQYYVLDQQKEALALWSTSNAVDYQLPAVEIAEDSVSEFSKLTADINIYIEEMMIKYITGQKSIDTFETEYLPTLQEMGVETVIGMYQTALDNYNAR